MNYLRKKDDDCYLMCKVESRLFERASKEGIPSAYFIKVYAASPYCWMMDNLDYLKICPSEQEIFSYIKDRVKMSKGTIYPEYVMAWVGYLLREWAYLRKTRMKTLLKDAPLSYLCKVYPLYHTLSIEEAIDQIALDRGINVEESFSEKVSRILKMICLPSKKPLI